MQDSENSQDYITHRQRLTLLIVMVSGHALKHIFNSALFVMIPQIKSSLGLTNTQIGIFSTFRGIAGGLANIPAGYVGDKLVSYRGVILGTSIITLSIFALALGSATTFWLAVIAASLYSISITFWHPSAISSLSREFVSKRGFAISLHGTGGSVGETLGPIIVGLLIGIIGWRAVLQGSVLPGVIFGVTIWAILRTIPSRNHETTGNYAYWESILGLLKNRRMLLVLVFAAGFTGGQSTILTFLPVYLDEQLGATSITIGLYLSMAQVGGIVSQPLMGYASDRLGRKAILSPSLTALGLSFIGLAVMPAGWILALNILFMGAFLFPLMAILLASAMDLVDPGAQATTVSLVFGASIVVSALAPSLAGLISDALGIEWAFLFGATITLAASLLSFITNWTIQPKRPLLAQVPRR